MIFIEQAYYDPIRYINIKLTTEYWYLASQVPVYLENTKYY